MSVDTSPKERGEKEPTPTGSRPSIIQRVIVSLQQVSWVETVLLALVMAIAWCALFLINNVLQILAGIVPVMAGLYLGRRVKGNYMANGIVLGLSGFIFGLTLVVVYGLLGDAGVVPMPMLPGDTADQPAKVATFSTLLLQYLVLSVFALIPFPAFGTVMAGRTEQRNRELKREVDERGGRLERPGVVRTLEDLRGLSLPQFGSFVSNLYKKKGFDIKDYRFVDKDKHLDLELEYNGEPYLLRLSVADKVRVGTVEGLLQDMRRREIRKGVVITSTEFAPDAAKAAANKRSLVAVDGPTLFGMAEL